MDLHDEETAGRLGDHSRSLGRRIPSLDEALQYSPFTSIVPFSTEIIVPPEAVPRSDSTTILSTQEQNLTNQTINFLNSEIFQPHTSLPRLVDQVLGDLQHSLNPQELSHYNLTIPSNVRHTPQQSNEASFLKNGQTQTKAETNQLGPFAQMTLNTTRVSWDWSTSSAPPATRNPKIRIPSESSQVKQASSGFMSSLSQSHNPQYQVIPPSSKSTTHVISPNAQAHQQPMVIIPAPNAYANPVQMNPQQPSPAASYELPSLSAPGLLQGNLPYNSVQPVVMIPDFPSPPAPKQMQGNSFHSSMQPIVMIPDFPPSSDPSQYQSRPDLDAAVLRGGDQIPRKRKREDHDPVNKFATDHREEAAAAVQSFQEMLMDIFEAEDQLESGDIEISLSDLHRFFIKGRNSNGPCIALDSAILNNLEKAMTKVINLKRFEYLQVEQLSHLQRLSLASLTSAAEVDLKIPLADDDDEIVDEWVRRMELAENGLRASRLLLKMMTANKSEKELSSEELVRELVNNLQHVLDTTIIPLVEKRKSSEESRFFDTNPKYRALVLSLMQRTGRILKLSGDLVIMGDLSETSVTTVEFLATKLVFTENAPSDKESILGVQKFETLRRYAMDVVAKVFLRHPEQRDFLLSEILSSLAKLPVTRQSARQYKIAEGKPIQLVSALIMQLVQTSTMRDLSLSLSKNSDGLAKELTDSASEDSEESSPESSSESTPAPKSRRSTTNGVHSTSIALLEEASAGGSKSAETNAASVCHYLVQRGVNTTKTGDQPYRNLLDIFTEDFLNVLGFPEWPAAEILLRALLVHFLRIAGDDKSSAPAKNMALDLMGTIGSGIADLRAYVKRSTDGAETDNGNIIKEVSQISEDSLAGISIPAVLLRKEGLYRVIVEHLQNGDEESLHLQSARCFYITQWARNLCEASGKASAEEQPPRSTNMTKLGFEDVARWLTHVMHSRDQKIDEREFVEVRPTEVRLYHALVLLNMPLCKAFDRVFNVLLRALSSQQATVRSRGVKSVSQLLEKDAKILDRAHHVMAHIVNATTDPSPLVRDSALTLIGKCMALKPSLESDASNALIGMSCDAATGVRKRALKLLRDLYLRNKRNELRAAIADAILRRLDDIEESIVDLARQSLENVWLTPFYGFSFPYGSLSAQARHDLEDLATLIVATVSRGDGIATVLETLFKQVLSDDAKNGHANQEVFKAVVALLFESIIDNEQGAGKPSRKASLQTLTVFAKSEPHLFDAEQMITLRPYIDNISFTSDDILVYRSIVMIYRRVLPVLPPLQKGFLLGVQDVLLNNITKLGKQELNEATACLWIINDVLQNIERLARVTISVLVKIEISKKGELTEQKEVQTMKRLIMLAGYFGKACDFQSQLALFQEKSPGWNGTSVADLIVDILIPLAGRNSPTTIRESALDSICLVCQAWPRNFLKSDVSSTFRSVFEDGEPRLVSTVLSGIRSFYLLEDERTKGRPEEPSDQPGKNGTNKLGKSMTVSHNDGASTSIAQQFLKDVLHIALSARGDLAMLATDIITSTNRQGLVHPKECGPALVSLETSPDPFVAKAALEEHRSLHSKHESMMDKEYVKAVEQAFLYQRDTIGSPSGVDAGMNPKLRSFYEVLKTGSIALRKKLLTNLCGRINTDGTKSTEKDLEYRLHFSRFVLENLGLFEYPRVDELLHLISCIEKIFTSSGNTLSQRIESLLGSQVQGQEDLPPQEHLISHHFDRQELYNATITSMILSMLWATRSYLRQAWGLQSLRTGKAKPAIKDMNKAPVRVANVSIEDHVEHISQIMKSLETEEKMVEQCKNFVATLTVDSEFKAGSDEEEDRYGTPSEEGTPAVGENGSMGPPSTTSKRSRKMTPSSMATTPRGTPIKKERRPSMARRRSSKMSVDEDDELGWD